MNDLPVRKTLISRSILNSIDWLIDWLIDWWTSHRHINKSCSLPLLGWSVRGRNDPSHPGVSVYGTTWRSVPRWNSSISRNDYWAMGTLCMTDEFFSSPAAGWTPGQDTIKPDPEDKLEYFKKHPGKDELQKWILPACWSCFFLKVSPSFYLVWNVFSRVDLFHFSTVPLLHFWGFVVRKKNVHSWYEAQSWATTQGVSIGVSIREPMDKQRLSLIDWLVGCPDRNKSFLISTLLYTSFWVFLSTLLSLQDLPAAHLTETRNKVTVTQKQLDCIESIPCVSRKKG